MLTCIPQLFFLRFLNPQLVTKVSPSDDIEGINNFDIFVIQVLSPYCPNLANSRVFNLKTHINSILNNLLQEGPKPGVETEGVILDYDRLTSH